MKSSVNIQHTSTPASEDIDFLTQKINQETPDFGFAIAIITWIAIFLATGYVKMKKAAALSKLEAESDSQVWGNIVDYITNMFSVKIFSSYSHEKNRINEKLTAFITGFITGFIKSKCLSTSFVLLISPLNFIRRRCQFTCQFLQ